ncbi:MAG: hypothetical protein MPJ78_04105 [Hyphomicrobiaceae bacterium]|nr:hypothetical protein [Hyphomicrobiaceae bacterium]
MRFAKKRVRRLVVSTPIACAFAILALTSPSPAKPLSSDACVALVNEHASLLKAGVESHMRGDPAAAGSTLNPRQLANIDRFLFIEGQIRFRCREIKLPGLGTPKNSETQAADFQKRAKQEANARKTQAKKRKGPAVPLPDRNPKRRSNAAG